MIDSIWIKIKTWNEYYDIAEWAKSHNIKFSKIYYHQGSNLNRMRITTNNTRLLTWASLKWNVIDSFNSEEKNKR